MPRSHAFNGYVFDHGPHGPYSRDEELLAEFRQRVGDGNFYFHEKWSQIHYREKFYNHPLRIGDVIRNMSFLHAARAACSFFCARLRARFRDQPETNAREFLINHFGRVLYEEFFRPYTEKVWAVAPERLDVDFVRDRVPHLNLWDVLRKLFTGGKYDRVTPSGRLATHDAHRFYYPKQGAGVLGESLAAEFEEFGGTIEPSVRVTHIDTEAREVYFQTERGPEAAVYDRLLSTIPLRPFLSLLSPPPPARILSLADKLKHRSLLLACLCVNRKSVIGPFWIYFTNRLFNRLSEYNKFSADVAPAGKTGLCVEIGCDRGDELYSADDDEIGRKVVNELEDLGLLTDDDVEDRFVIREPFAYPVYHVGYRADVEELINYVASLDGVRTAGRQGAFSYINQDQALKAGRDAGKQILRSIRHVRQPEPHLVGASVAEQLVADGENRP